MKLKTKSCIAVALIAVSAAIADIPGMFVIQESRLLNTAAAGTSSTDKFGGAGVQWIGDINDDGVQDLIAGAPNSFGDSGSLAIFPLDANGKAKSSPILIKASDPLLKPLMTRGYKELFGMGVEVLQKMSATSCGTVVASSSSLKKVWAIRLCPENGGVKVDAATTLSTFTEYTATRSLRSFKVIDTASADEFVLAAGMPNENSTTKSYSGKVQLLKVKLSDLTITKLGALPETNDATDPIGSLLNTQSNFGSSIVRLAKKTGTIQLAIASPGDSIGTRAVGRIHFVNIDATTYARQTSSVTPLYAGADTVFQPTSLSVADFDHDDVPDLLAGQSKESYSNITEVGSYSVALMKSATEAKAVKKFGKGIGGFVDTNGVLGASSWLGSSAAAFDFDSDNMVDVAIGNQAPTSTAGSIWVLRMKSKPWVHKASATIAVSKDTAKLLLNEYVTGNALSWSISEMNAPVTGSLTNCSAVRQTASGPEFDCNGLGTNGTSVWKVTATDHGNPTGETFSEDILFTINVVGSNIPPSKKKNLPDTLFLREDQPDTAGLLFSSYYDDADGTPGSLTYTLSSLNKSAESFIKFSVSGDELRVSGIPYKSGVCSLQVNVKDAVQAVLRDTLVIKVRHVNHPPKPIDTTYTVSQSTSKTLTVRIVEYDLADVMTGSVLVAPKHGKVSMQGNLVSFVPDSFFLGADSFQYKASDNAGGSGTSMVRLNVVKTSEVAKVYRPLEGLAIDEDSPEQIIKTDSLLFSGADQFQVPQRDVLTNCMNLKLADITLDRIAHRLSIKPLPDQYGACSIRVQSDADSTVGSTMQLTIKPVLDPYYFSPSDTLIAQIEIGTTFTKALDSADRDRDTLEYVVLDKMPDWVSRSGYHLVFKPVSQSQAGFFHIQVKKKALANVTFLESTDTLTVLAIPSTTSSISRRLGGATTFSVRHSTISFQAGSLPIRVALVSTNGRVLASGAASEYGSLEFDKAHLSKFVYVRLSEGGRVTNIPLFVSP